MRSSFLILCFLMIAIQSSWAQSTPGTSPAPEEKEIINLSKDKWQWMAYRNVDKLATLFHEKSKFVHMSGTWKKDEELEIIKIRQYLVQESRCP